MKVSYKYKPIQFFVVANLITWTTWLTAAYFSYQKNCESIYSILELIGIFGPVVAALWLILSSNSKELKKNFYNRLLNLKLIKPWSLPAIFLIMPATVVISVLISWLFFGQSLDQLTIPRTANFNAGFIPIPVLLFGAALLEELGWKGYGVDCLRGKRTFFTVTLIYAALWAFWHVPTFFINNYYQHILLKANPAFALNFIISIFPGAFIINWLWYKNKGSIVTAVLCHAVTNFQGLLLMGQIAKCIQTVVMLIVVVVIVSLDKKAFFKQFPERIGHFD
jgi:membrane protease YdiL (CAAX protease family)